MIRSAVAFSDNANTREAADCIASAIRSNMEATPDVIIVFASSAYDFRGLLAGIKAACAPKILIGCSSAGEFASGHRNEGAVSAVALQSDEMVFSAGVGRGLSRDRVAAAAQIVQQFKGQSRVSFRYRTALVLTDALAGYSDALIENLNVATGGTYQFVGGGAGDDANFATTHVFLDEYAYTDAAVALEILSNKPVGIGVRHGWEPASAPMRVTQSEGMRVMSLNGMPAAELYVEHLERWGQSFDASNPLAYFLHNVIGIETETGYKLRVPLAIDDAGALVCASEVPEGTLVCFMRTEAQSAVRAAAAAADAAIAQLGEYEPSVALFFDCVATRLRMGSAFADELGAVQARLDNVSYGGCNTYGQIARLEGQFSGFHNCTAVVCAFPR